jgi:glycerol-3-phosphate acyltransferase PlsY
MKLILGLFLSYLIGSIPTGLLVGKLVGCIDVRESGSGNIGATNVARLLGKKWGGVVLGLDILKGLIPVALIPSLLGLHASNGWLEIALGLAAVLGHCFSIFLRFTGGKGVATAIGVFLAIAPVQIILLAIVGIILIAWKGYVSLASVVCAALLPFFLYLSGYPTPVLFVAELLAALVIVKHWGNLERLLDGREHAIWDFVDDQAGENETIPTTKTNSKL